MKKFVVILFLILLFVLYAPDTTPNKRVEDINICFTIDNNYVDYLLVEIYSIFQNNKSKAPINIFIINNQISDKNKRKIKKFVEKNKHQVTFVESNTDILRNGIDIFTFTEHITKIGLIRLKMPTLLPDIDKIIYLDADMLIKGDISKLNEIDISDYPIAMALDTGIVVPEYLRKTHKKYYNSGVIIMNLGYWRKNKIEEKLLSYLSDNLGKFIYTGDFAKVEYRYPDQDLLNIVLKDQIVQIPPSWNSLCYMNEYTSYNKADLIHYAGPIKPWDFKFAFGAYATYMKYWLLSPFRQDFLKYYVHSVYKKRLEILNGKFKIYN